jgi:hypothetical protein
MRKDLRRSAVGKMLNAGDPPTPGESAQVDKVQMLPGLVRGEMGAQAGKWEFGVQGLEAG